MSKTQRPHVEIVPPGYLLSKSEGNAITQLSDILAEHALPSGFTPDRLIISTDRDSGQTFSIGHSTHHQFHANIHALLGCVTYNPDLLKAVIAHEGAHIKLGNITAMARFEKTGDALNGLARLCNELERRPAAASQVISAGFSGMHRAVHIVDLMTEAALEGWRGIRQQVSVAGASPEKMARLLEARPEMHQTIIAASEKLPGMQSLTTLNKQIGSMLESLAAAPVTDEAPRRLTHAECDFIDAIRSAAAQTVPQMRAFAERYRKATEYMADAVGVQALEEPKLLEDFIAWHSRSSNRHTDGGDTHPPLQSRIERMKHRRLHGTLPPDEAIEPKDRGR